MTPQSNQYVFIWVGFLLAVVVFYAFQVAKRMKALIAVKVTDLHSRESIMLQ